MRKTKHTYIYVHISSFIYLEIFKHDYLLDKDSSCSTIITDIYISLTQWTEQQLLKP